MEGSRVPGATRVLLIENDRVVRALLAEMLGNAGLHVFELADGESLFGPEPPCEAPRVVVTDLDLGAACRDGLEVARQARRLWPEVGVVFITAQPARLNEHEHGARDRFVVKPFRAAQLVEAVASLLRA
jgi:two-component system cell cycle response regulator CpdR